MDYRRYSVWTEWAVAAAVIVLHGVIFLWPENPSNPNYLLLAGHDSQFLAAIVLIIAWVVLGPGPLWIRLAAAPALVGLWFLPWNGQMQPRQTPASFVVTIFCVAALLIGSLRAFGLRIEQRSQTAGLERGAQFSLLGLLVATTLIAAGIGGLEALRPALGTMSRSEFIDTSDRLSMTPLSVHQGQQLRQLVMATGVALAALGGVWVTLRPGAPWLRLAALVGLVPAISVYLTHLSNGASELFITAAESLAIGFAGVAAVAGLSVLPLRLKGFRLQRHARSATVAVAAHSIQRQRIERTAAVLLLGLAATTIPWAREQMRSSQCSDLGRINGGVMSWGIIRNGNELVPPLNAFGEWTDRKSVILLDAWSWHPYVATVRGRQLQNSNLDTESPVKDASDEINLDQP